MFIYRLVYPRTIPEDVVAKQKDDFMCDNVRALSHFLATFKASDVYATSAPEKSPFKEDLNRLHYVTNMASKSEGLQESDLDDVEFARSALIKSKTGPFYQADTIYPLGVVMMDLLQKRIGQCRTDQLLHKELAQAGDFAHAFGEIKKDTITKDKGFGDGDFEIIVPSSGKYADMVAKFLAFKEGASSGLQSAPASKIHAKAIENRMAELQVAFEEAHQAKYESKLKALNDLLQECTGGWNDDKVALCSQELQKLTGFQPFPKFQSVKLLGKVLAGQIDESVGCLTAVCKLLQAALPHIGKLSQTQTKPAYNDFFNHEVINLVAGLDKKENQEALRKFAPTLTFGLDAVSQLILSSVTTSVGERVTTFGPFLTALMETEIVLESILKTDVVGAVDADADNAFDWGGVYIAFIHFHQSASTEIEMQMKEKKAPVKVHLAFLCLAGALLQVAKYAHHLAQAAQAANAKDVFATIYQEEFKKKKDDPAKAQALTSKMDLVSAFQPHFAKMSSALQAFQRIMSQIEAEVGYMDNIKDFFKKLLASLQSSLQLCVQQAFGEIDSMKIIFASLFKKVLDDHKVMEIFSGEKLSESSVGALLADPNVKLLVFLGGKAGPVCEGIGTFVSSFGNLPKDDLVGNTLSNMIVALSKALSDFAAAQRAKCAPSQMDQITLSNVSWLQGSMTLAQVMTRTLGAGETRLGLVGRCLKLLDTRQMGCEPALKQKASQLQQGKK